MGWMGNPAFKDADDAGSKWLKSHWKAEVKNKRTTLSFRAWCRELGVITAGNPSGWDDIRRVSMVPLSSVNHFVGDSAYGVPVKTPRQGSNGNANNSSTNGSQTATTNNNNNNNLM